MNRLGRLIVHHPRFVIWATLAVTVLMAIAILVRGVGFDGSIESLTRKDNDLAFYNELKSTFGDDRVIIIGLTTSDVFNRTFLGKLDRMTSQLAAVDGVADAQSLTNIKAVDRTEGGIVVDRLIPGNPDDAQLQQLRNSVPHDPLYAKNYVSLDGKTAAINVFLKQKLSEDRVRATAEEVERVARSAAPPDEIFISGVPVVDARGIRSMLRDMLLLSPLAGLLCIGIFYSAFRTFWGALLPMAALLIGLVWVIGLMSLAGRPVTMATLPLPVVVMAVGGSYMFHVLNQYRLSMLKGIGAREPSKGVTKTPQFLEPVNVPDSASDTHAGHPSPGQRRHGGAIARASQKALWLEGLAFIMPAVLVSGLATTAGFGSVAASSIPTVRDMGIFESAGVSAMLILTLTFLPAVLTILRPDSLGPLLPSSSGYSNPLSKVLNSVTSLVLFRRKTIWTLFLAAGLIVGLGVKKLVVDTDYLKIFPEGSETVQSARKLHSRLAGSSSVELVVTGAPGSVYDPQFLRSVAELEQFARTQPGIDTAVSVADIVKRINALMESPGSEETIPGDRKRVEDIYRDFLSNDPLIGRLVNLGRGEPGSRAIIVLRTDLSSSQTLRHLTGVLAKWSAGRLPQGVTSRATGAVVLLNGASDAVAASQVSSLAIALAAIYLMMVLLFRSLLTGILALVPNLLPIAGFFGFLGWMGIPLDITTSLVATSALGLAVDNAVHMIRRYRQCAGETRDEGWCVWMMMSRTGRPMVLANSMLVGAFLIFTISSFVPVRLAGLLWAVTITACLAADLVFLPVLMKSRLLGGAALGRTEKSTPVTPSVSAGELQA
ncbi:MAG TPA: MMPL family transporter [Blastocatellia bacterium]|nr:MMPL family transporter [Blastocatellia bacterium]